MIRLRQKDLREMVHYYDAEDVTNATDEDYSIIMNREGWLRLIGYSAGTYGCNGMLLQGHNTGKLYAITSRTVNIYRFG